MLDPSIWEVAGTRPHCLFVVDGRVLFLLEHGRVNLLLLVSEESCLSLIDSWVGAKLKSRLVKV